MCGIVGLYLKNVELQAQLGSMFKPMLIEMSSRGPDSAGVAIYRNPVEAGQTKISLAHDDSGFLWETLETNLAASLNCELATSKVANHCILVTDAAETEVISWLQTNYPEVRIVGSGKSIEIFKEVGPPEKVYEQFELEHASGTHMIGHTRMATESAVTTAGSHPFATGADLCLVHNGSLSNHNILRNNLEREGIKFQTENDTEVAGAYMTWKIRSGATLRQALEDGIKEIDGFYTFCIGTQDGFAVVRDPIACKHAVMAETDDWVAMATEFRAIAHLPGSEQARIWEPEPSTIYVWGEQ
ncbi:MAG: glutamine amidotransferase family protein [Deltaproteobacteria bacterium]|jgi:amidophosphoribosyltransferase|nr:glutamine amidotransferase family protein [Deltaproteobacteria bacterium]